MASSSVPARRAAFAAPEMRFSASVSRGVVQIRHCAANASFCLKCKGGRIWRKASSTEPPRSTALRTRCSRWKWRCVAAMMACGLSPEATARPHSATARWTSPDAAADVMRSSASSDTSPTTASTSSTPMSAPGPA